MNPSPGHNTGRIVGGHADGKRTIVTHSVKHDSMEREGIRTESKRLFIDFLTRSNLFNIERKAKECEPNDSSNRKDASRATD